MSHSSSSRFEEKDSSADFSRSSRFNPSPSLRRSQQLSSTSALSSSSSSPFSPSSHHTKSSSSSTSHRRFTFTPHEIEDLRLAFDLFDVDSVGKISLSDLHSSIEKYGYKHKNPAVYSLLMNYKEKKDIDFNTFIDILSSGINNTVSLSTHGEMTLTSREDVRRLFMLFDEGDKGSITLEDLHRVGKEIGEVINMSEMKEMMERADLDGDGVVSFEEFYTILTKQVQD